MSSQIVLDHLRTLVAQSVQTLLSNIDIAEIALERPADMRHGDWSTNVAMQLFGELKKTSNTTYANPRELAEAISSEILKQVQHDKKVTIESVTVAGPGFINFTVSKDYYLKNLEQVLELGKAYGSSDEGAGKRVIVEYSSPNIAKPFTIGHLRSTVIGDAVASILAFSGYEVMRDNHLGDWGTQFGKQLYALMHLGEGTLEKNIEKILASENPVKELVALYVEFHEQADEDESLNDAARGWFKKLEDGDEEARRLWKLCVDWSWEAFHRLYDRLAVSPFSKEFDEGRGLGEAFFEDRMGEPIQQLRDKGLLKEGKDGAELVFFDESTGMPPAMILKKDGSTLYHTRDLATDWYRKQHYNPDLIINEVGAEQTLYFEQLYAMEALLGWYEPEQRVHIKHGLFRFKDVKMSTRKGNVVWLEDVVNEAVERAKALQSDAIDTELAEAVAVGALKYNDLMGSPKRDIVFDWDTVLSMRGNSGPYLQYTYARCKSVEEKAIDTPVASDTIVLSEPEESVVLRLLERYAETIERATKELAPHHICTYLYELAQAYNVFYAKHRILDEQLQPDVVAGRLALSKGVSIVLASGLSLLGIPTPEKL